MSRHNPLKRTTVSSSGWSISSSLLSEGFSAAHGPFVSMIFVWQTICSLWSVWIGCLTERAFVQETSTSVMHGRRESLVPLVPWNPTSSHQCSFYCFLLGSSFFPPAPLPSPFSSSWVYWMLRSLERGKKNLKVGQIKFNYLSATKLDRLHPILSLFVTNTQQQMFPTMLINRTMRIIKSMINLL